MERRSVIGFDRRIDLDWLDAAAASAASHQRASEMRVQLHQLLHDKVRGDGPHSARGKTVTVLHHIWGDVPRAATGLRERASRQLADAEPGERLALHWAMMLATYPFFVDLAVAVGRIQALQDEVSLAHLIRRLSAEWGERSTLSRASQRIVRSMVQWKVVEETHTPGLYAPAHLKKVRPAISMVLVEGLLVGGEDRHLRLGSIPRHPAFFPFQMDVNIVEFSAAPQFNVHREGMDCDVVELN